MTMDQCDQESDDDLAFVMLITLGILFEIITLLQLYSFEALELGF